MDPYAAKLATWLAERKIDAEQLLFEESTHSVAEAALAAKAREDEFVKSICMMAQGLGLVVAVVKGEDRASTTRVGALVGAPVAIATREEVLAHTGYPAGGTPPFGFPARFFVDERVMERERVLAGGGSDRALVKVDPRVMVAANEGSIARVRR